MSEKQEREARRRHKQGELALGVLQGITPQSCPDAAERAASVSRILRERLAVKCPTPLSVAVDFYVQSRCSDAVIRPGPGRLVCRVHPAYLRNQSSFVERKHGFDIDDLVAAIIPLNLKAAQRARSLDAYHERAKCAAELRDKLGDEGMGLATVSAQTGSTGFKVSFVAKDLETAEDAIRHLGVKFGIVEHRKKNASEPQKESEQQAPAAAPGPVPDPNPGSTEQRSA